jgi:archaellin
LLGYSAQGRSSMNVSKAKLKVLNLKTNTVVESCDVTFDENAPFPCDVFECVDDKEIEESIFVVEEQ